MPKLTPAQRRLRNALERGVCYKSLDFDYLCSRAPHRAGVIIEGDSWVDYPRKYIITGPSINLGHRFEQTTEYLDTVNVLRIGSNGDTAVGMTTGKQFALMKKILKKNGKHIRLMLFSAGGNDIVGESDLDPLIKEYDPALHHGWEDVIEKDLFDKKLDAILDAYLRMIELYKSLAPAASIVTHTYDCVNPSPQGAAFFWNLIKTKSWVWPTMQKRNIPIEWRAPIIQYMLSLFSLRIQALQNHPSAVGRFYVVDTQGTLDPTSKADWLNEIHATPAGYRKIFNKMYPTLKQLLPELP
jgi:lysophospholipase L1-like esterase